MAQGRLEATGTIQLDQFWPKGKSDADTAKILIKPAASGFRFRPHSGASFRVTHAFDNAKVRGRVTKPPIDKKGRITVRLQGIDAPELHYRPQSLLKRKHRSDIQGRLYLEWNHEYRQYFGETATQELVKLLERAGQDPLPCKVVTAVDEPDEVFDTYARFIGDILVQINGQEVNINTWLVKEGWAFPAFYASMSDREIETLMIAANDAWSNDKGIWPHLPDYIGKFNWKLRYQAKPDTIDPEADKKEVILPKLFRRLSKWAVNRRAKMFSGRFWKYLRDYPDYFYLTEEFLEQGAAASQPRRLSEFLYSDGFFELWPEDLVFQESGSRVIGPGGATVTW